MCKVKTEAFQLKITLFEYDHIQAQFQVLDHIQNFSAYWSISHSVDNFVHDQCSW